MADLFIEGLRVYMRAGKMQIHDFVVMPNHVHILMTIPGDTSLEKAMQLIKGSFSYKASHELDFKGEVWQRGYSDVRIVDEQSFAEHRRYIAQNPVRAGLVQIAEDFPFGSTFLKRRKQSGAEAPPAFPEALGTTEVVP